MPFDIKELQASLSTHGYLKPHAYDVTMLPPKIMTNEQLRSLTSGFVTSAINISQMVRFRAEQASIPGVLLLTGDTNRYGIGPTRKMPMNVVFNDTSFTFLADDQGLLWSFFYVWANKIFSWDKQLGGNRNVPSYEVEYRDEYVTDIVVNVYDTQGLPVKSFKFIGAYPNIVPGAPLDWAAVDTLLKLNVGFTFERWELMDIDSQATGGLEPPTTIETWTRSLSGLSNFNPVTPVTPGAIN